MRNAAVAALGDSLWGLQGSLVAGGTVFALLMQQLGATKQTIGFIGAIESGAIVLPQVVAAYFFRSKHNRKAILLALHLAITTVCWLSIAALLWRSEGVAPATLRAGLLLLFALYFVCIGFLIPPWIDWLADLFPARIRGTVLGLCLGGVAGAGALGALIAGRLIALDPRPEGYARHYALAAAIAALSMAAFWFVREDRGAQHPPAVNPREVTERFFQSLRDRNFRAFLFGRTLMILGFAVGPFIAVHYTGAGGGLSPQVVVACSAAQAVTMALSQLTLGRYGDARGHKPGLILCCVAQTAALGVMLVSRGGVSCVLAYAVAGLAAGSGNIAQYNIMLETCPHQLRIAHITASSLVLSVAAILAPLGAGFVAERWGTPALFLASVALSVVALVYVAARLREPRELAREGAASVA